MPTVDKGTSVLASLTAKVMDTMESKQAAAKRTLTPVAAEVRAAPRIPDVPGDFLTHEGLEMVERELRAHSASLLRVADGLATIIANGEPVYTGSAGDVRAVVPRLVGPAPVKVAPTVFETHLAAQAAAAQEATFKRQVEDDVAAVSMPNVPFMPPEEPIAIDVGDAAAAEVAAEGWVCPEHKRAIIKTSTKSGRTFTGCPDCNLFER